jgi:gamma-glutamylcyclotransferase (GGCT)/AIG2-like uncharacterized protein YtfP
MDSKDYLFVYGTLRKGFESPVKEQVSSDLEWIGQAKVKALLYDMGTFPGAIKSSGMNEVLGDVYRVANAEKVFKVLDHYEGYLDGDPEKSEYIRVRTDVQMNGGKILNVWIYWCNLDLEGKPVIKNKDYLRYLKKKTS